MKGREKAASEVARLLVDALTPRDSWATLHSACSDHHVPGTQVQIFALGVQMVQARGFDKLNQLSLADAGQPRQDQQGRN